MLIERALRKMLLAAVAAEEAAPETPLVGAHLPGKLGCCNRLLIRIPMPARLLIRIPMATRLGIPVLGLLVLVDVRLRPVEEDGNLERLQLVVARAVLEQKPQGHAEVQESLVYQMMGRKCVPPCFGFPVPLPKPLHAHGRTVHQTAGLPPNQLTEQRQCGLHLGLRQHHQLGKPCGAQASRWREQPPRLEHVSSDDKTNAFFTAHAQCCRARINSTAIVCNLSRTQYS